ncbi:RNA recognition motif domain-containing protein [Salmonirosea aquatica]|uniref:RRM domain-containing protein n=1 Tax=Salmonirosea aquatica TaxID=2654236 RepID=A0A7C9BG76_9BACT|nr:hypothetical protein [Cytophagaceae bacterium SJW1-29]
MDIYVGSLPFKMKEAELREIFEKYGEVSSAKIIIDKMTRQSKGFGFVEMPDVAQAKDAISNLNGQEIMGRELVVNESQKTERTGPRPGGNRPGGGGGAGGYRSGGGEGTSSAAIKAAVLSTAQTTDQVIRSGIARTGIRIGEGASGEMTATTSNK